MKEKKERHNTQQRITIIVNNTPHESNITAPVAGNQVYFAVQKYNLSWFLSVVKQYTWYISLRKKI